MQWLWPFYRTTASLKNGEAGLQGGSTALDEPKPHWSDVDVVVDVPDTSDNTAVIRVRQGTFRLDDPRDYTLGVRVDDGGRPPRSSIMHVPIKVSVCVCVVIIHL